MKIFDRDCKINFVDKNNVFLGYDMSQSCCEKASWFISDIITEYPKDNDCNEDLEKYVFDTSFFKTASVKNFDDGEMAIFRIVKGKSKKKEKFIHIYNCHNGYYSHGFEFTNNGKMIQRGDL